MNSNKHSSSGIGILAVVQIVFIILKVLDINPIASWSWGLVLIPLWIDLVITMIILIVLGLIVIYNTNKKY